MNELAKEQPDTDVSASQDHALPPNPDPVGRRDPQLEKVAAALLGATASLGVVFALLGANSDRVWGILDDSFAKKVLGASIGLAILAITLGLWSLLAGDERRQHGLLVAGTVAFIASLVVGVWALAAGANQLARPTFTHIGLRSSPHDEAPELVFTMSADSLDSSQRIGVRVVLETNDACRTLVDRDNCRIVFDSTVPPDSDGTAQQEVTLLLPNDVPRVLLFAWHRDNSTHASPEPACASKKNPEGATCASIDL